MLRSPCPGLLSLLISTLILAGGPTLADEEQAPVAGMKAPHAPPDFPIKGEARKMVDHRPRQVVGGGSNSRAASRAGLDLRSGAHTTSTPAARASRAPGRDPGPVSLSMDKSWNGSAWELVLSWTGHTGPTTVSYSPNLTFEHTVRTLESGFTDSTLTVEAWDDRPLECFDVTDGTTVSRAVQAMGYDPAPRPGVPTLSPTSRATTYWWWESVTLDAKYLDPNPLATHLSMQNRAVKATGTGPVTNGFASQATFVVPADARSFWAMPVTNGRMGREAVFHKLVPKNLGPYANIRTIVWAPQTGHTWIAADGKVEEVDIFKLDPSVVRTFSDAAKPHLSKVTSDGRILYVDGVAGATTIWQVNVSTGVRSSYATTTDTNFTRSITPRGIAVAIDGSVAYIADAAGTTIVRIPESNTTDITDDWGNWPFWGFDDPAGIDTTPNGSVLVGAINNWVGIIPDASTTWWAFDTSDSVQHLELDREVTPDWGYRVFWGETPGTHAYNRNPIEDVTGTPVRNVGALVLEDEDGLLVAPLWDYMPLGRHVAFPARVLLNGEGESYDYPWKYQLADRLIELEFDGWNGVPLHLRLIDPPDMAPYAPAAGWPATGGKTAVPPYEANDNAVWEDPAYTDFGLTTDSLGTIVGGPKLELDVTPDSDGTAMAYLVLPQHYSGDNWRVEVTKKSHTGVPIPNKVPGFSAIFTGWKRSYIERERMFREGGLLSRNAWPADNYIYLANLDFQGSWVKAHFLEVGDIIVLFDTDHSAYVSRDIACVKSLTDINQFEVQVELAWPEDCVTPHLLIHYYNSSVDPATHQWTFEDGTRSAGVGVISGCSTANNKMNTLDSCFFDGDMRSVEKSFSDAFLEFLAPGGVGIIPYLPSGFFEEDTTGDRMANLSHRWFENLWEDPGTGDPPAAEEHNWFHLLGASLHDEAYGESTSWYDYSYIYTGEIMNAGEGDTYIQDTTNHELAHLYDVNPDDCEGHDTLDAWCLADCSDEKCLMNVDHTGSNGIFHFCVEDLYIGALLNGNQTCDGQPTSWSVGEGAIRTTEDPH